MAELIKCNRAGQILLAVESTPGFPAADIAEYKLGRKAFRLSPVELLGPETAHEDLIVVFRRGTAAAQRIARMFDIRLPKLPPSGYHIECKDYRAGNALLVVGGDLFGMLAGLSDAILWSSLTSNGLHYRGGTKTEKPAFPIRYYWTWDHSTNWVLGDPGNQVSGCENHYLKKPETYLEDYKRLINHCIDMRFNGIVVWGFLRDAHGGEHYASRIAQYAADRGVRILPGVGTTGYGGIYFEGDHPCNLNAYLGHHHGRGLTQEDGKISRRELSPYQPDNQKWIQQGVEWLYRNFPIGGGDFGSNDLMVDYSSVAKRHRKDLRTGEAEPFKDQYAAYIQALEVAHEQDPDAWNIYSTYCGFGTGTDVTFGGRNVGPKPYLAEHMPPSAIAQWTLSGMLSARPPKLRAWLDDGSPAKLFRNRLWPKSLTPPTPRSVGLIHQGSQWHDTMRRNALCLKPYAEAALRAHRAGMEGVGILGEVSSVTLPAKLNYLAMRHWTYYPNSTLEEFGRCELTPRLGGREEAAAFIEALCLVDEGKSEEAIEQCRDHFAASYPKNQPVSGDFPISRLWEALLEWCRLSGSKDSLGRGVVDVM